MKLGAKLYLWVAVATGLYCTIWKGFDIDSYIFINLCLTIYYGENFLMFMTKEK